MKFKTFYPIIAVLAFSGLYGQVGINTANPQSTLDIVGNVASTSTKDGVTAPRITRQQLAAKVAGTYAAAQSGTLVYVTDFTTPTGTTPSLAQTVNITKVGYYYFDGTVWKQISDTDSPSVNIYNSDGTLTGNRIVTQGANTLAFNGSAVNAFSVDSSTFSVDAANNRIGFGTIAPGSKFDIVSDNEGSGAGNDFNFTGYGTSKNPAIFLNSAGGTLAAPTNLVTGDFTGRIFFTGRANNTSVSSSVGSAYRGDGTTALTDLMFTTSNVERMRIDPTGNVGIANTSPTNTLDVNGTTRVRTINTAAGSDIILPVYSDATGVLVKPTTTMFGMQRNGVTLSAGATGTLLSGIASGAMYKLTVTTGDACGYGVMAEFYIIAITGNTNIAIKGIDGLISTGTTSTTKAASFTESARNVTAVTWSGKPVCVDGGNSTAQNFTVTVDTSPFGTISITNNGNVSRGYVAALVRLN